MCSFTGGLSEMCHRCIWRVKGLWQCTIHYIPIMLNMVHCWPYVSYYWKYLLFIHDFLKINHTDIMNSLFNIIILWPCNLTDQSCIIYHHSTAWWSFYALNKQWQSAGCRLLLHCKTGYSCLPTRLETENTGWKDLICKTHNILVVQRLT